MDIGVCEWKKMIGYDLHIHTEYCGHAPEMTVEVICRRADELQLSAIAITDHIYEPADMFGIEQIRKEVRTCQPRCRVYIGAEIDVDADYTDGRLVTDVFEGLDYVIAGFHYVPTQGHYPRSPDDRRLDEKTFLQVWESSLLGIVSNPAVHTLAHPGRMLAACMDLDIHFEYGLQVMRKAAEISARNHIAWELNELTGSRLPAYWQSQWHRIYQIALDAGVKLVYGSDAHTPAAIGTHAFVNQLLRMLPPNCLSQPEEIILR